MDLEMTSRKKDLLLQQLTRAHQSGKLSKGIKDVYNAATHRQARLLLIEENFDYGSREVLDDIMEKVLKAGGDVEFVEPGLLVAYDPIVLIE